LTGQRVAQLRDAVRDRREAKVRRSTYRRLPTSIFSADPVRRKLKDTTQFVDGAAVAAWKVAKEQGSPFTAVYIADKDEARRDYCGTRLRALGAQSSSSGAQRARPFRH